MIDPKNNDERERADIDADSQPLTQRQENEEGLVLVNDDGTPFDTEERTYISVNLPEEKEEKAKD